MANDPNDPTTVEGEHQAVLDRVMEPSKAPDGTPVQMDGFEVIDPEEETAAEEGVPQVSGAAPAPPEGTAKRRGRKANVEEATTR
jgi:hypothetical protein